MKKSFFCAFLLFWICSSNALAQGGGGTEIARSAIAVSADLEMYLSLELNATEIYFHIADDGREYAAHIDGSLCSNNGQYLFICSSQEGKEITELQFKQDVIGRTADAADPIPVEWQLQDACDADPRPGVFMDPGSAGPSAGIQWLLCNGASGCHTFTITLVVKPGTQQPDGRYEMEPLITVVPAL